MTELKLNWYLYMIRCRDGSLYTGITTNVSRRLAEHQSNKGLGAKYLRGRGPLVLVFKKKLESKNLALVIESKVKKLPKVKKEKLTTNKRLINRLIERVKTEIKMYQY